MALLNASESEIVKVVCDPDVLADYMQIPSALGINITTLSKDLCKTTFNETISYIRNSLDAGQTVFLVSKCIRKKSCIFYSTYITPFNNSGSDHFHSLLHAIDYFWINE